MGSLSKVIWVAFLAGCILPEQPPLEKYAFVEPHMGTRVRIVLYAHGPDHANRASKAAYAEFTRINGIMSDYLPESELSRLSRSSGAGPKAVSSPLLAVLAESRKYSEETDGAFDVTVGPVVRLWRRARKEGKLPDAGDIREARARSGWRHLTLHAADGSARLARENMLLDLGGIAKGYACDEALKAMAREGVTRAFVDAGGGMALGDPPPDRPHWRIRVADRRDLVLEVANRGVATSGDVEQFVDIDGVRYSHIVDPATGIGLSTRSTVTVVAPDGMTADALATAVSVMGPERGLKYIESKPGIEVWMRWLKDRRPRTTQSTGFAALLRSE